MYALGLRNAWGLAFHPISGAPYVTDNGSHGHDEINRVVPGGNYGSPEVSGIARDPRFVDPIWESAESGGGITGLAFYSGPLFPRYQHDLLFCSVTNGQLIRLKLGGASFDQVLEQELLSNQCHLDVVAGPDGAIYFSSINQVLRLVPVP